jgi:hypothetical protein
MFCYHFSKFNLLNFSGFLLCMIKGDGGVLATKVILAKEKLVRITNSWVEGIIKYFCKIMAKIYIISLASQQIENINTSQ